MRSNNNLILTMIGEIRMSTKAEIEILSNKGSLKIPADVSNIGEIAKLVDPYAHTGADCLDILSNMSVSVGGEKVSYVPELICNADDEQYNEEYDAGFNKKTIVKTVANGTIKYGRPFNNFIYDAENAVLYGPKFSTYTGPVSDVAISRDGVRRIVKKVSISGAVLKDVDYHYFCHTKGNGRTVYFKATLAEKLRDPANAGGLRVSTKTYAGAIVAAYVYATETECEASEYWEQNMYLKCYEKDGLLHNDDLERFYDNRAEYVRENIYNICIHSLKIRDNVLGLLFGGDKFVQLYTDAAESGDKIGNCAILAGVMCALLNSPDVLDIEDPLAKAYFAFFNFTLTSGAITYEGNLAIGSTDMLDNKSKITIFQNDFKPDTFDICAFLRTSGKKPYMHAKLKDDFAHYGVIQIIDDEHCTVAYDSLGIFDPTVVLNTKEVADNLTEYHIDHGFWDGTKASMDESGNIKASNVSLAALNILDSTGITRRV